MGYFDNYLDLYVSNGATSDETDINDFASDVHNSFNSVENDILALQSGQNQANKWAREEVGILVSDIIGGVTVEDYSAYAYATEAKRYASNPTGTSVVGADLVDDNEYSAKAYALEAKEWATNSTGLFFEANGDEVSGFYGAATYASNAASSASDSSDSAALSEAYAEGAVDDATVTDDGGTASAKSWAEADGEVATGSGSYSAKYWANQALGSNTVSAGTNITITPTDLGGSFDYEISTPDSVQNTRTISAGSGLTGGGDLSANRTISHSDTSSQSSVNNSGAAVIQDVTLDTYGHVTALGSKTLSASDVSALPLSGGSMTGAIDMQGRALTLTGGSQPAYLQHTSGNMLVRHEGTGNLEVSAWGGRCELYGLNSVDLSTDSGLYQIEFNGGNFYPTVDSQINCGFNGKAWLNVYSDAYPGSSDRNLKTSIKSLDSSESLDQVLSLNPVEFKWKGKEDEKKTLGFIAQEVAEVLSDHGLIHGEDGNMSLNYQEFSSLIVSAVKAQQKKIDDLEDRIAKLEALLNDTSR